MTIVVGYVPTPEGEAALTAAISEAQLREEPLHIVNSSRGDSLSDPRYASEDSLDALRARLDGTGIAYEVKQFVRGHDASEELVAEADRLKASLIVIGLRRRMPMTSRLAFSRAAASTTSSAASRPRTSCSIS